eukprot:6498222-Pyramimonas_sp.AAC.1
MHRTSGPRGVGLSEGGAVDNVVHQPLPFTALLCRPKWAALGGWHRRPQSPCQQWPPPREAVAAVPCGNRPQG